MKSQLIGRGGIYTNVGKNRRFYSGIIVDRKFSQEECEDEFFTISVLSGEVLIEFQVWLNNENLKNFQPNNQVFIYAYRNHNGWRAKDVLTLGELFANYVENN